MKLQLKDISKSFNQSDEKINLFTNLNITVNAGESKVLMGASGCGKTTLLRIINGLETPDSGEITFDELSLYQQDEVKRREFRCQNIGFADQHSIMLPQLTAIENVLLPTIEQTGEWIEKAKALLIELGLEKRINAFPHELSGGELQRVALCRALILSPSFLLLDEPTSALDQSRSHELLKTIKQLNESKKVSVIIASHDPMVKEYFSDIIYLDTEK